VGVIGKGRSATAEVCQPNERRVIERALGARLGIGERFMYLFSSNNGSFLITTAIATSSLRKVCLASSLPHVSVMKNSLL